MDELYGLDRHYDCPGEHQIAALNRRLMRGELTTAEHAQAIRALDPDDERLIARMAAYERFDSMDCRPPGRSSGVDTADYGARAS